MIVEIGQEWKHHRHDTIYKVVDARDEDDIVYVEYESDFVDGVETSPTEGSWLKSNCDLIHDSKYYKHKSKLRI